ncbi:MAG: Pseudopaline exporter CntI [Chlamydiia bacterium]|nr:Pseudopaline exporter CntI [Chlamydiia bacterium]MCH9615774.1 Pseudopaline exporter CntI [Chlamydiia bacterium]MCH9628823.1 Pseudopaline exporter CntI [Chlamydiia bacterium]
MKKLYYIGLIFATLSALVMAVSGIATRMAGTKLTIDQLMFFRFVFSCIYMTIFVRGYKTLFVTKHWKLHLARDIMGILGMFLLYTSYQYANVANATALFFVTPFFVPIFLWLIVRIPIMHKLYLGIAVAFVGVLLVLHIGFEKLDWHLILALSAGILAAPVLVTIRLLTEHGEPTNRILAYYFTFSLIVSAIYWLANGAHFPQGGHQWTLLLIIALTVTLYQQFLTLATKYCPARLVAPFQYSAVIFSAVLEFFIWGVVPTWASILGIVLIILGAIYVAYAFHVDSQKKSI